jgi:uncharacterized protein YecT (DUF1311 family)
MPLNVNRYWRHNAFGSNTETPIAAFTERQDGSIRQVQAAECIRSMTEDRARELEKAMKLD